MFSKLDTISSIVDYLREPSLSSTTKTSKSSKKQEKSKNSANIIYPTDPCLMTKSKALNADIEITGKGRVRYGPITVNPRRQPSKTLFTGRRSKYEILSGDDEDKRRDRRERNRVAATKCREKRESVLAQLEIEENNEKIKNKNLIKLVKDLEGRKTHLETILNNHLNEGPILNNLFQTPMIFGDTEFLSKINDAAPPLPLPTFQQTNISNDEEESNLTPTLTNSAYKNDEVNNLFNSSLLQPMTMTTSSIDRLINNLQSPKMSIENSGNCPSLFNSAYSSSSCAKQHSHSSEDDSVPKNSYVC